MPQVVIIGAGAAGLLAAISCAGAGARTLLLERTRDGGRKILISGGGRCNILPMRDDEKRFVTDSSPHALRKILRSWPLREQVAFFTDDLGMPLLEEPASGKMFPASQRARDVRDGLLGHARRLGVDFRAGVRVTGLRPDGSGWLVEHEVGPPLPATAVVLATGGLSVPTTGSDGGGLQLAAALGHTVHATYPALTPLTAPRSPFTVLAGVSLEVAVTARGAGRSASSTGGFLFTHRGYSGPAVLDVSHVLTRVRAEGAADGALQVCWSELDADGWRAALRPGNAATVAGVLRRRLPASLAEVLLQVARLPPQRKLAELRREERSRLIETLVHGVLPWTGDEGYSKAEVTGGGVSLAEVSPRSLESRLRPGLFLCGEMLDAFGPIGGFNFQWAWATGRAAGRAAAVAALRDR